MRKLAISLILTLGLCGSAIAQTMSGFPFPSSSAAQTLTSGTSFVTSTGVAIYTLIVVGGAGGGASSTGAGVGGSGASGNVTICEMYGGGTTITYTLGTAGTKGAAGASGGNGGNTVVDSATQCTANGGNGGTNGTASAGAGGTIGAANTVGSIVVTNSVVGAGIVTYQGSAGSSGSAFQPATFAIMGGAGCGGANCTTNTAGQTGTIFLIPENY